jgi:hypothetical protein
MVIICKGDVKHNQAYNDEEENTVLFNRTPIQMEWFYYLEGEKTKLNWFLLEIALEYYDRIQDSPLLTSYRELYDNKQIAQYCVYHTRRTKENLLKLLRGQRKSVILYEEYIADFYPHHSDQMNKALSKVCDETWGHMLKACANCPQQCLRDYKSRCFTFEQYED